MQGNPKAPRPNQVWRPTRGKAKPKRIVSIGRNKNVWTEEYPEPRGGGATNMPYQNWLAWVDHYDAHCTETADDRERSD